MAYKRQTSFSPFSSKREVSSKDASDQLALAKALESQRKQSVKEFAGASSQQIEELGESVKQKVFKNSGIQLNWEIERVGNK